MTTATEGMELTRVGPGTVMGDLMRCYWIPAALSSELARDGRETRYCYDEIAGCYYKTRGVVCAFIHLEHRRFSASSRRFAQEPPTAGASRPTTSA